MVDITLVAEHNTLRAVKDGDELCLNKNDLARYFTDLAESADAQPGMEQVAAVIRALRNMIEVVELIS